MKLYELTQSYQNLFELVDRDDIPNSMLVEALHKIEGDITDKIENTVKVIKTLEAEAEAFKKEEKRLSDRRKAREFQIKSLKQYIEMSLTSIKRDKLKCNLFTVAMQNNNPKLVINDISKIPAIYYEDQSPIINNAMLSASIKSGFDVPGAELQTSKSLRIR